MNYYFCLSYSQSHSHVGRTESDARDALENLLVARVFFARKLKLEFLHETREYEKQLETRDGLANARALARAERHHGLVLAPKQAGLRVDEPLGVEFIRLGPVRLVSHARPHVHHYERVIRYVITLF